MPEVSSSVESVHFGIGCLYFGVPQEKIDSWPELVTSTLKAIPNVSRIRVFAEVSHGYLIRRGLAFPITATVSFKLKVSYATQKSLAPQNVMSRGNTQFSVLTYYEYDAPVTFVMIEKESRLGDSNKSVVVVREYLRDKLKGIAGPAVFATIGPSPFHVDASVRLEEQEAPFELDRIPSLGYDEYTFLCSSDLFKSAREAAYELFDELKAELSYFYSLVIKRESIQDDSADIAELSGQLIEIYERRGVRAWIRRAFTSSAKMRTVALKAVIAQYDAQDRANTGARGIADIYSSGVAPYFKSYLDEELADDNSSFLATGREIAALLDQARGRQIETTSLFLSALAGGLAGALVSVIVHLSASERIENGSGNW